jgi:plastocyanin
MGNRLQLVQNQLVHQTTGNPLRLVQGQRAILAGSTGLVLAQNQDVTQSVQTQLFLQETGTAATCPGAVYCAGGTKNTAQFQTRVAQQGGGAGAALTDTIDANAISKRAFMFECPIPAGAAWNSGTWMFRVKLKDATTNLSWTQVHICRVNASCTNQATIGSNTGVGANLTGTDTVYTATVSGSAQTPSAGDKVIIVLSFTNADTVTHNVTLTPDQLIDTPFLA